MSKPQVGCHLIMWRGGDEAALTKAFDDIAAAGYTGLEGGRSLPAERFKPLLAERNLAFVASHTGVGQLDENLAAEIEFCRAMGTDILCVSTGRPKEGADAAAHFKGVGEVLERNGAKAHAAGIKLCLHNHAHEIEHDLFGLKHILAQTRPEHVQLCLDLYWIRKGGGDPLRVLRAYRSRTPYIHFKDYKDGDFAEIGQGSLDWPAIARELEGWNIPWVMVEQDRTNRTPKESAVLSRTYIKEKLGW